MTQAAITFTPELSNERTESALVAAHGGPAVASFENVSKSYGNVAAIRDVSLHIGEGELVALLGPNGAGKSTTIHLLLGLLAPTKGRVRVFGGDPSEARTRTRLGAMLQNIGGPTTLKVREVIDLFRSYYPKPLPTKTILERADLIGLENRLLGKMSGGERKRVRFALAICGDPRLIYLDEPTANLDVTSRRKLYDCIRASAAAGVSIVLATHFLEEADELATRVVLLNKGRILQDGTPAAIKGLVALQHVTCHTRITEEQARKIPGVREVARAGDRLDLRADADISIGAELYKLDPDLKDLAIQRVKLEDAFVALIKEDK